MDERQSKFVKSKFEFLVHRCLFSLFQNNTDAQEPHYNTDFGVHKEIML